MVNKVLIIKRGAMGDILMSTPMLRQLKTNYPRVKIDYCVSSSFKDILLDNPYLNKVIDLPDRFFTIKGILSLVGFLFKIRRDYDYVFILGKSEVYNILVRSIMSAKVVGFARGRYSRFILDYIVNYDNVYKYQAIYYLELLKVFKDIQLDYTDLALELNQGKQSLNTLMDGNYVVITNSGGNNQFEQTGLRMLPDEVIIPLIKNLTTQYKVILLGSSLDYTNYQRYVEFINHPSVSNCAGTYNIAQSIMIIKNSTHFITTDCGAMHLGLIAQAHNKMFCLFGPTNYYHILPPNFAGQITWNDYDHYDINYQLYGKTDQEQSMFFNNIEIEQLILKILG